MKRIIFSVAFGALFGAGCIPGAPGDPCSTRAECWTGLVCLEGACVESSTDTCGELTAQGTCEGDVLSWCGDQGVEVVDCAAQTASDGRPMHCAFVGGEEGHTCVPADAGGCGAETTDGRCNGDELVYCESTTSGRVVRVDCAASGKECGVGAGGIAECRTPGTSGCGDVTYQGYCDGSVAVWCQEDQLQQYDCATEDLACGWVDSETGYWCMQGQASGSYRVRGVLNYAKRALTTGGLGAASPAPVRNATVQVVQTSDNKAVATGHTDDSGAFSLSFEATGEVVVAVFTVASNDRYAVEVRDCPMADCADDGQLYGAATAAFAPAADHDLGTLEISDPSVAGAFNVFDLFIRGFDFAWQNVGRKPPALIGQWKAGQNTMCGTSCFYPRAHTIYVLGTAQDTDEYDDPVLAHEFGHFLEEAFSRADSPGGYHDGSPTDPRLAWGEGYGTWVGCTIGGSPLYIDSFSSGTSVIDAGDTGYGAANPNGGMSQAISEFTVLEILWHMTHGSNSTPALGTAGVFDAMSTYFVSSGFVDRGVSGVDLVDMLDGWLCRGHGAQSTVQTVVNDLHRFPYDYAGPASCR